jgi:ribonuclease-3
MSLTIDPRRQRELVRLLDQMGLTVMYLGKAYHDKLNWHLLDQSLVHPSFSTTYNNDQLEFIGDSVLKLSVSLFLREQYGNKKVGELSALRAHLVSDKNLAQVAKTYDLQKYIVLSEAMRKDSQNVQAMEQTVSANSLEALMAAIYISLDDIKFVRKWLDPHMQNAVEMLLKIPAFGNYKLALVELTQRRWKCLPEYRRVDANDGLFAVEVWVCDRCWGQGHGKSIKMAQQAAAAIAIEAMQTP